MKEEPLFSVALIAKNEERSLPNLLRTLEEFRARGGEVVLVDTGSTDNTVKIAEEWGCRVIMVGAKFVHSIDEAKAAEINAVFVVGDEKLIVEAGDSYFDFGEARAYAMMQTTLDYVCCPGCDEIFLKLDIDKVNNYIVSGWTQLRVDYIWGQNPDGSPAVRFYRDAYLFDRRVWSWVGSIHETVTASPDAKWMNLPTDVVLVEHHQIPQASRKNRDLVGLSVSCLREPDNDRHAHYLARELMFKARYRSAVNQFIRHIGMNKWDLERGQSMTFMGDCYRFLGDIGKALEWYQTSFMYCSKRREPLMRMAEIFYGKKDHQRAACYAAAALTIPYIEFYANKLEHYGALPHEILYWALYYLGDKVEAQKHWRKALEYSPTNQKYIDEGKFFQ